MFVIIFVIFIILFYLYATRNFDYWNKKNVKHDKPIPLFGNHFRNVLAMKSSTEIWSELYARYRGEKLIGYYNCSQPEVVVTDPELFRQILTVDFSCFYKRGLAWGEAGVEPLLLNLFHVEGDTWRLLRQRLTAAFTGRKLKNMFPLIEECARQLQVLAAPVPGAGPRDVREIMARFTTDCIGSCGFGVEAEALASEDSQFRRLGKRIFDPGFMVICRAALKETLPEVFAGMCLLPPEIEESIVNLIKQVRAARNGSPSPRNDFIDLLLEMEQQGKMVGESIEKRNPDGTATIIEREMDLKMMAAQVFIFFAAGFETSSSATSMTLHHLAHNPAVQRRAQAELDAVLARRGGRLSYDAIAELTLLDQCLKESMRIVSPLGALNRVCTKTYTFPGTDVTIDPGVKVVLPVQSIHNDERYFDNPNEFRPERFTEEAMKEMNNFVYMPFGAGPRNCIGQRLGQMQSLAGLAAILQRATVTAPPSAPLTLPLDPTFNVVQGPRNGVLLNIIARHPKEN